MNDDLNATLIAAFNDTPRPIQDYLRSEKLGVFVAEMEKKYGLHVDVAGRLSDALTMLLLGIITPQELIPTLTEQVLIEQDQLEPLLTDVNEQLFKPLRAQEEAAPVAPPVRQEPSRPTGPIMPPPRVPMSGASPAAAVPQPAPAPSAPPRPAPAHAPVPMPAPRPAPPPIPTTPPAPPANLPGATDAPPAWSIPAAPRAQELRAAAPMPMPAPIPMTPPAALPKPPAMPPAPPAPTPARPTPTAPPPAPPKNEALHDVLKSYGVDPYREPLE